MKKQTSLITLGLLLATPALAGGGGAPAARPAPAACKSIAQIVATDPNFSTLASALDAAGLSETLMSGEYTVFAPTNAAFAKLPSDALAAALNDIELLRSILLYHVVPGKVNAKEVAASTSINTVQGSGAMVMKMGNKVMVENATVTKADVVACNGLIHVIDTVMIPAMDEAEAAPAAEAPVTEAPATEPAPAAEAPAAAPAGASILSIPVLPVGGATVSTSSSSTSTTTNTTTTDTTTATTSTATTETVASADTTEVTSNTCYDVIVADDRFSTLRDLLSDAGLTDALMTNEYTVFAPTNEAFDAFDQEQLALIASDPDTLKAVLLNHVVEGKITAQELTAKPELTSGSNGMLAMTESGGQVMIGEAKVDSTALTGSNCVIYPVDQVLVPADLTLPEAPAVDVTTAIETATDTTAAATTATTTATTTTATATTAVTSAGGTALVTLLQGQPQFSTLLGLIQQAGLVDTLVTGEHTLFAPTNDAFAKVSPTDLAALQADPAKLKALLLNHVVAQRINGSTLAGLANVQTAGGSTLNLTKNGERVMIGDSTINGASSVNADNINLTVYPIDTVIMPK